MRYWLYALVLVCSLSACSKMPVGFLQTADATYAPNKIYAYHSVDEDSPQSKGAPFSSTQIQGLAGTQPLTFEFHSVKATKGGDEAKFLELVNKGQLLVRGGLVQLFPDGAKSLPFGEYTLTLKVSNEGHSAILNDILTFVVKAEYEPQDDEAIED